MVNIPSFYHFLNEHQALQDHHNLILVPDYLCKKELLRYIALKSEVVMLPKIVCMDSLATEVKSVAGIVEHYQEYKTLEPRYAEIIYDAIVDHSESSTPLFKHVWEELKALPPESVYGSDSVYDITCDEFVAIFIKFLRQEKFYLKEHANLLIASQILKENFSNIFFFSSVDQSKVAQKIVASLIGQSNAYIFNEKISSGSQNVLAESLYTMEYNNLHGAVKADIFAGKVFITKDQKVINSIKAESIDKESNIIITGNIDLLKLMSLLLKNKDSDKSILKMLKLPSFMLNKSELGCVEKSLRDGDNLDVAVEKFADIQNLVDAWKNLKEQKSFKFLFNKAYKFFKQHAKVPLYLEKVLNNLNEARNAFMNIKANKKALEDLLAYIADKTITQLIDELSPVKNISHVRELRYICHTDIVFINLDHEFADIFNDELNADIEPHSLFCGLVNSIPNRDAIAIENLDGSFYSYQDHDYHFKRQVNIQFEELRCPNHNIIQPTPAPTACFDINKSLSPTSIQLLMHNPYLFYIKEILNIKPVNDLEQKVDSKNTGVIIHSCLEAADFSDEDKFIAKFYDDFLKYAFDIYRSEVPINHLRVRIIAKNLYKLLTPFLCKNLYQEVTGKVAIGGVKIKARADLIVRDAKGNIAIIDYKTGMVPTNPEVNSGKSPQLAIEKLIAENQGFAVSKNQEAPNVQTIIIKVSNTSGEIVEISADSKVAAEGIHNLKERFLTGSKQFFATNNSSHFLDQEYRGIIRVDEWVKFT